MINQTYNTIMRDDIAREGDFEDPTEPDGRVMKTSGGHYYEMGVNHDCDHPDCPANINEDVGCPYCDWSGEIAETHDRTHSYATHVIVRDGEVFEGKTCSMRTKPKRPGLLERILGRF